VAAALAGAGLVVAACGGGSHPAGGGDPASQNQAVAVASFVRCMHSHGLPGVRVVPASSIPDLASSPNVTWLRNWAIEGANSNTPQFQSAMKSCVHLLGITLPNGTETHQQFMQGLKTAMCMRAHGYPNWPDPQANSPGAYFPSNVDFNSPQWHAAAKACGYSVNPPNG
jgi:hypothetical protein